MAANSLQTRLHIKNGRVIDPANGVDQVKDLFIADGRILAVGTAPVDFRSERVIDATGWVVAPGLIDLCARLREPGLEHKANIASETRAAAASGITTLCLPPDTDPVIDTPAVVELIHQRAGQSGQARLFTLGALTRGLAGEQISEMAALKAAGCVGISNARQPVQNGLILRRAMEYAMTHDLTVFLHPDDSALSNNGCVHEGAMSTRLGLPGIPQAAETAAVARDLALIEQVGVRAHFCRLSTARAVQMVGRAQYDGLPVSADVGAHHLFLTEMDIMGFNSQCHVLPPLRTQRDRDGLREGVARGVLTAVCSDHQPHERDAKLAPFIDTEPGISSLETLLPLMLRLVDEGVLSLSQALARLTHGPAQTLGIESGTLAVGASADLCLFDPARVWRVDPHQFLSRGHNTPFAGWELQGRVMMTVLEGRVVFEHVKISP
ncbi:MAG: dihydroorotase [Gammaproteobacteria bacterium]